MLSKFSPTDDYNDLAKSYTDLIKESVRKEQQIQILSHENNELRQQTIQQRERFSSLCWLILTLLILSITWLYLPIVAFILAVCLIIGYLLKLGGEID